MSIHCAAHCDALYKATGSAALAAFNTLSPHYLGSCLANFEHGTTMTHEQQMRCFAGCGQSMQFYTLLICLTLLLVIQYGVYAGGQSRGVCRSSDSGLCLSYSSGSQLQRGSFLAAGQNYCLHSYTAMKVDCGDQVKEDVTFLSRM